MRLAHIEAGEQKTPKPSDAVEFCPGPTSDGRWIVVDSSTSRAFRLQRTPYEVLRALACSDSMDELRQRTAGLAAWDIVTATVDEFVALGLVAFAERTSLGELHHGAPTVTRRLSPGRRRPRELSIDVDRRLDLAASVLRRVPINIGVAAMAVLIAAGAEILWSNWSRVWEQLSAAESLGVFGIAVGALFLSSVVHELGHAFATKLFGGRVRRIGVKFTYLLPGFFCDCVDMWRLSRGKRAVIALSGVLMQLLFVSAVCVAAPLWTSGHPTPLGEVFALTIVLTLAAVILSLVPLGRSDGFVAIAGLVDIPDLRSRIDRDLRSFVRQMLGDARAAVTLRPAAPWIAFGLAHGAFQGIAVVLSSFVYLAVVMQAGRLGLRLTQTLVVGITVWGIYRIARGARRCLQDPSISMARLVAGIGLVAVCLAFALTAARVPISSTARIERVATTDRSGLVLRIADVPAGAPRHLCAHAAWSFLSASSLCGSRTNDELVITSARRESVAALPRTYRVVVAHRSPASLLRDLIRALDS